MPYDGEQFEPAVALRAGACGQYDQRLRAVLGEENLAVDVDAAEFGMDDRLALVLALGDLLQLPQSDELGAVFLEFGEDPGGSGGVAARCQRDPQTGRLGAAVVWVVLLGYTRRSAGSMNQR
ncbi:hypothetical protein O3Q52_33605 [Streptomyces sp. ActVer]|nr:hypothetical protein [Streptomyces sp. ActVer]MCZ4513005.1 hypothetical protein [Streptomyces sp. ActVer]